MIWVILARDTENTTDPAPDDKTGESEVQSPKALLNRVFALNFVTMLLYFSGPDFILETVMRSCSRLDFLELNPYVVSQIMCDKPGLLAIILHSIESTL